MLYLAQMVPSRPSCSHNIYATPCISKSVRNKFCHPISEKHLFHKICTCWGIYPLVQKSVPGLARAGSTNHGHSFALCWCCQSWFENPLICAGCAAHQWCLHMRANPPFQLFPWRSPAARLNYSAAEQSKMAHHLGCLLDQENPRLMPEGKKHKGHQVYSEIQTEIN